MTQEEAREAIAGKRRLSVFLTDSARAFRMMRVQNESLADAWLPSDQGEFWALTGDLMDLPRGCYGLPIFDGRQQPAVVLRLAAKAAVTSPRGLGFLRVVVEADGVRFMLYERASIFDEKAWPAQGLPVGALVELAVATETPAIKRQRERYEKCMASGLRMPDNPHARLPSGVGLVAKSLEISTPSLTSDVKAHIRRLADQKDLNERRT